MTNPKDPWGQRPDDAPTEHLGSPGQSGFDRSAHTDDPTVAYGGNDPTVAYGGTSDPTVAYGAGAPETSRYPQAEQFEPWAPPPPNATQQMPTHESQWGGYESGGAPYDSGYGNQWAGRHGQPGAMPPSGPPPGGYGPGEPPPPKRNTGLWIALALGVIALIAVVGVAAGVLLGNKESEPSSNAAGTSRVFPTLGPSSTGVQPSDPVSPSGVPGLPGLDGIGATMGTISANDGATLTLSTLSGDTVTVRTSAKTQVISLSSTKVSELPVGDVVMVQGDESADGSIDAKLIISAALPGGPR
ncbi:DUF5666 domain-containing protein [Nocardia sp. NBC_01377]|uniref:DUF5666 domain-containing protein n=1 Tax=Nocardia sp. NBC_01377 TaxID=2903595 RepID=UPI003243C5B1